MEAGRRESNDTVNHFLPTGQPPDGSGNGATSSSAIANPPAEHQPRKYGDPPCHCCTTTHVISWSSERLISCLPSGSDRIPEDKRTRRPVPLTLVLPSVRTELSRAIKAFTSIIELLSAKISQPGIIDSESMLQLLADVQEEFVLHRETVTSVSCPSAHDCPY